MTNCKNYFDNETHTINTLIDKECLKIIIAKFKNIIKKMQNLRTDLIYKNDLRH